MKTLFRLAVIAFVALVLFAVFGPNLANIFKQATSSLGNSVSYTIDLAPQATQGQLAPITNQPGVADLAVKVQGLKPHATYYITLDQGRCGGPRLINVGVLSTDEDGGKLQDYQMLQGDLGDVSQTSIWMDIHEGDSTFGKSVQCQQVDTSLLRHSLG